MEICNAHNLSHPLTEAKPYGIRVTMPATDTFARVLGTNWERFHWYATREERDAVLKDMAGEHVYSRRGDRPTTLFEPVERSVDPADPAGAGPSLPQHETVWHQEFVK